MTQTHHIQPIYPSPGNVPGESSQDSRRTTPNARRREPVNTDARFESTGTFLRPEEIHSLTDRTRRHAQVKVLRALGIEHKVRPDGGIAVLRAHITKVFDGSFEATSRRHQKEASPNWLAI